MENTTIQMLKEKVEALWQAIQKAPRAEKESLRKQYQAAYQLYKRQLMIVQAQ